MKSAEFSLGEINLEGKYLLISKTNAQWRIFRFLKGKIRNLRQGDLKQIHSTCMIERSKDGDWSGEGQQIGDRLSGSEGKERVATIEEVS